MSKVDLIKTDEEKVVPLRAITGGRPPAGGDWLSSLKTGTQFLTKPLTKLHQPVVNGYHLIEFTMAGKRGKAVLLADEINGKFQYMWVDPLEFSRNWSLFEILEVPEEETDP